MPKFRLKPGEIEAVQFDGTNWVEMINFTGTRKTEDGEERPVFGPPQMTLFAVIHPELIGAKAELWMETQGKTGYVKPGDWIVKGTLIRTGAKGFHLMKNEIFEELYERLED